MATSGSCGQRVIFQALAALPISSLGDVSIFSAGGGPLDSQTVLPANLYQGASYRIRARGIANTGAASITTVTAKLKAGPSGGTVLTSGASTALTVLTANIGIFVDCDFKILGQGTAAPVNIGGQMIVVTNGSPSYTMLRATTTIDTTSSNFLDFSLALSSLLGAPSMTIDNAILLQTS